MYQKEDHLLHVILDHRAMLMAGCQEQTLMAGDPRRDRTGAGEISSTTPNNMQFKTYELFISGIFHLIFLNHSWLQVTEAVKSETPG